MRTSGGGGAFDEQTLRSIWRALGSYIAKQLTNGKGVIVPRFGTFTFTAAEVNLAVSSVLRHSLIGRHLRWAL